MNANYVCQMNMGGVSLQGSQAIRSQPIWESFLLCLLRVNTHRLGLSQTLLKTASRSAWTYPMNSEQSVVRPIDTYLLWMYENTAFETCKTLEQSKNNGMYVLSTVSQMPHGIGTLDMF